MNNSAFAVVQPIEDAPGRSCCCYAFCKRPLDVLFALFGFVLGFPVIAFVAVLVKLTSRGPIIYSQVRLGLGGRPFRVYKLRTMYHNCEALSGPCWSVKGDSRITPVGRFLRWSHLDELPQMWNILIGDMSLIGPRPERPEMVPNLERAIPRYRERLQVRPGLTGLAQVQLPPDTDLNSVRVKLAYDLRYLERFSFWLDCRIFFATFGHILGMPYAKTTAVFGLPGAEVVAKRVELREAKSYGLVEEKPVVVADLQTV